jgi:hypothetical protein
MKRLGLLCLVLVAIIPVGALAAGGLVALQTAAASCTDESGNIYVDCGNGTVTDNRTGLVWLKNANCLDGPVDWHTAMEFVAGLSDQPPTSAAAAHDCGLSDGSSPGEWRLPSAAEWEAMTADALGEGEDPDCFLTITNDSGLGCLVDGPSSFSGVQQNDYWSSNTDLSDPTNAFYQNLGGGLNGYGLYTQSKGTRRYVWPVRGGQ